jgi:hypothetical protein
VGVTNPVEGGKSYFWNPIEEESEEKKLKQLANIKKNTRNFNKQIRSNMSKLKKSFRNFKANQML